MSYMLLYRYWLTREYYQLKVPRCVIQLLAIPPVSPSPASRGNFCCNQEGIQANFPEISSFKTSDVKFNHYVREDCEFGDCMIR
ncbi:transmembrane protein 168 [Phyllostomus discolor]|uniref:Transmembrane protein 168 n=1 Tax=Phyllostomus discolor TaxID=89673 RepID=A0A834DP44_9CHIR|nr:transmembrane protein 168 [Phyllostomus discolor]